MDLIIGKQHKNGIWNIRLMMNRVFHESRLIALLIKLCTYYGLTSEQHPPESFYISFHHLNIQV